MNLIITTPEELRAIVAEEVGKAVDRTLRTAGERVGIAGMAARYGVTERTISNWDKQPGKLPPRRAGRYWLLSDVQEWDKRTQRENAT